MRFFLLFLILALILVPSCSGIGVITEENAAIWVRKHIDEVSKDILDGDVRDFVDCLIDWERTQPKWGENNFWKEVKQEYVNKPYSFSGFSSNDPQRIEIANCGIENLSQEDYKTLDKSLNN